MVDSTSSGVADQIALFVECKFCSGLFVPKTKRSSHCSEKCRYRTKERTRMIPCAVCGELMHTSRGSRPAGEASHQRCRSRTPDGELLHGRLNTYKRHGCRCDECRRANSEAATEWQRKAGYWSRPDVVVRRSAERRSPEGQERERLRQRRYYEKNRAAFMVKAKAKEVRRKGAPTVKFTTEQLESRLSMFAGCWICGVSLDAGFHIDHVKPLARGGWHCLSNLRPACVACNLMKGAKWPYPSLKATSTVSVL